tara:strand:+ start:613 stop:858 length:246 start_codon:yes stop_codon:yes gene_type:complete
MMNLESGKIYKSIKISKKDWCLEQMMTLPDGISPLNSILIFATCFSIKKLNLQKILTTLSASYLKKNITITPQNPIKIIEV